MSARFSQRTRIRRKRFIQLCVRSTTQRRREIPFERQVPLTVKYKGFCVGEGRADLLVGGELIVELKSVEQLAAVHVAQVISYLKAFERPLGLLITFNVPLLKSGIRRVVNSRR